MAQREHDSEQSYRTVRKRPREDYEGLHCQKEVQFLVHLTPFLDAPRKRGRYSDPGPRGKEVEVTSEQRLESLITRVGEKVKTPHKRQFYKLIFFPL